MKKLTGIRNYGRYLNPETGKSVNVKKGRVKDRSTDVFFYYRSGERVFISDSDFYNNWKKSQ